MSPLPSTASFDREMLINQCGNYQVADESLDVFAKDLGPVGLISIQKFVTHIPYRTDDVGNGNGSGLVSYQKFGKL